MWNHFDALVWSQAGTLHGLVLWIFLISGVVSLIVWIAGYLRRACFAGSAAETEAPLTPGGPTDSLRPGGMR